MLAQLRLQTALHSALQLQSFAALQRARLMASEAGRLGEMQVHCLLHSAFLS